MPINAMPQHVDSYFGRVVQSDFVAPWWAKNRHVQTIFPRFLQKRQALVFRKERFILSDGDFVQLAWVGDISSAKGLVIMFHGLEGSIYSHYCHDMAADLARQGFAVVVMHFRGCGGESNQTPRAYHSGETSDPWEFISWLQASYPSLDKFAIGFSLGGNMLLKLLGERPQQGIIKAALAISAPLQLAECAQSINQGFSKLYQSYLLKSMVTNLRHKMSIMDYQKHLTIKYKDLHQLKNFRDFDQYVTAPLHGFLGADDYYLRCSAMPYLSKIQTPTLVLHAKDDPFMNENVLPRTDQLSIFVRVELSEHGGHVGFVQGSPWRPKIWMQQRVSQFLTRFDETQERTIGAVK
tara:strand:+ start:1743 stop:2795 length:1053 start_codon:yes stop_codon:yes gene_type:complete